MRLFTKLRRKWAIMALKRMPVNGNRRAGEFLKFQLLQEVGEQESQTDLFLGRQVIPNIHMSEG